MSTHYLKIAPEWFDRVASGEKVAEIRKHDRDFQVGDTLVLVSASRGATVSAEEFASRTGSKTVTTRITHLLPAHQEPSVLLAGTCLLSLRVGPTMAEVAEKLGMLS